MNSKQAEALGHFTFALVCIAATCAAVYFIPLFAGGVAAGVAVAVLREKNRQFDNHQKLKQINPTSID